MKRKYAFPMMASVTAFMLSMFVLSNTFAASAQKEVVKKKATAPIVKHKTIDADGRGVAKGPTDPDLHAHYVSANFMDNGNVQINGRIENEGGGDFISDVGSAAAMIVLHQPGTEGPEAWPVIKQTPITRINQGDSITISETIDIRTYKPDFIRWGTDPDTGRSECQANLNNMEFYIQVNYDPDLHDDRNPRNDDDDHSNDKDRHVDNMSYVASCPG
jgi:hypothetical protein